MSTTIKSLIACVFLLPVHSTSLAQPTGFNYDESKVPNYELPDPLVGSDGKRIESKDQWPTRRAEIHSLFEEHVYGKSPGRPPQTHTTVSRSEQPLLDGQATRKQVRVFFSGDDTGPFMDILIYQPIGDSKSHPTFVGLNFAGNHSIRSDPDIWLSKKWMRPRRGGGVKDNRATDQSRGASSSRWPVEYIVSRGYAVATIYCGDLDPDYHDGFQNGVHPLFYTKDKTKPEANEWGTIGAWAWGLSRAMDYFETDPELDHTKVAVMGHSRLGKTALWAGAQDERFAMVVSNNSGCGGAALSRRRFGETVERINDSFPHWFNGNFKKFNGQEDELPVDQHMLIALIAPRPVLVCSAEQDRWADPRGEFLSCRGASDVYKLLETDGCAARTMPGLNEPVMSRVGYHIRPGKHDVTKGDWKVYLDFADKHVRGKRP